jgi:hypothetical protein
MLRIAHSHSSRLFSSFIVAHVGFFSKRLFRLLSSFFLLVKLLSALNLGDVSVVFIFVADAVITMFLQLFGDSHQVTDVFDTGS